jgi:hypothetical protein
MANYFSDSLSNTVSAVATAGFHAPAGNSGHLLSQFAKVTLTTDEDINTSDVIAMMRIPWTARIWQLTLWTTALGADFDYDIGVYSSDGANIVGAVKDVDLFDDDYDSAAVTADAGVPLLNAAALTVTARGQTLHALCGDTDAPNDGTEGLIALTLISNPAAVAGTIIMKLDYLANA